MGLLGILILFGQALAMVSGLCGATWGAPWLAGATLLSCPLPHTTWLQPDPGLHMGTRSPVSSYLPPGLLPPGPPLRMSKGDREIACREENEQGQILETGAFLGSLGPSRMSRSDSHAWPTAASHSEPGPLSIIHQCPCGVLSLYLPQALPSIPYIPCLGFVILFYRAWE